MITKTRFIVEQRNGHLKTIFKFLDNVMQITHLPNLGDLTRIAGALINCFRTTIHMEDATPELARNMLEQARAPNVLQARVERDNLANRQAARWVTIESDMVEGFPILSLQDIKNITMGTYQIRLAASYIQDKLNRDGIEVFEIEMLRDENQLPEPGLIRVRAYSRFRNATKYQLWVTYDDVQVTGRYCTCKSGARTLGTCAHITSVIWFFGFARNQLIVKYPPTTLLTTILDAASRIPAEND